VPAGDLNATGTLKNTKLYSGNIFEADPSMQELLDFLIQCDACPEALKISSRSTGRHNAFYAVITRCNHPGSLNRSPRLQWIVHNVMQYADLEHDIYVIVPGTNNLTLLKLIRCENNVVVSEFLACKFQIA